jgi:hypothetical protein
VDGKGWMEGDAQRRDGRERRRSELRGARTSGTVENKEGARDLLEGIATIDLAKVGR